MLVELKIKSSSWTDYLTLIKPRVVMLHIITAAAAMFVAANGAPPAVLLSATLVGGGLVAGAANALNSYFDLDIDRLMDRTRSRPLPAGRVRPRQALFFMLMIALAGFFILERLVSWPVAALALAALLYYIIVYTLWLKRHTFWSSLIGSGAGAFPPVIGWVAVSGQIGVAPFLLFAVIVFWTLPHFWSLAIFRRRDYTGAGLSMLPATHGPRWVTVFSLLLAAASGLLIPVVGLGRVYLWTALVLGVVLISLSAVLQVQSNPKENRQSQGQNNGGKELRAARYLYLYSIFYLVVLFSAMIVDRVLTL